MRIKYPPGVICDRMDPVRIDIIGEAVWNLSNVHSGTPCRYCQFLRNHVEEHYHYLYTECAVVPVSESKFYEVVAALDVLFRESQTWCEDCEELTYLKSLKELTADEQQCLVKLQEHRHVY